MERELSTEEKIERGNQFVERLGAVLNCAVVNDDRYNQGERGFTLRRGRNLVKIWVGETPYPPAKPTTTLPAIFVEGRQTSLFQAVKGSVARVLHLPHSITTRGERTEFPLYTDVPQIDIVGHFARKAGLDGCKIENAYMNIAGAFSRPKGKALGMEQV